MRDFIMKQRAAMEAVSRSAAGRVQPPNAPPVGSLGRVVSVTGDKASWEGVFVELYAFLSIGCTSWHALLPMDSLGEYTSVVSQGVRASCCCASLECLIVKVHSRQTSSLAAV